MIRKDGQRSNNLGAGLQAAEQVSIFDDVNWRRRIRDKSAVKLDDVNKRIFIAHFREHGRMSHAAEAAGVTTTTVKQHLQNDPDFFQMYIDARNSYADKVIEHAQNLIFNGTRRPILGGKDRDQIVAHEIIYPISLIQAELRKVDPIGYADPTNNQVNVNVQQGVAVVPSTTSKDEWRSRYSPKGEPPSGPQRHDANDVEFDK